MWHVARQALIERLLALRATCVEEQTAEALEVIESEEVQRAQMEPGPTGDQASGRD